MKKLLIKSICIFCFLANSVWAFDTIDAVDAASDIIVVWQDYDSITSNGIILAATKAVADPWDTPVQLSDSDFDASFPMLSINDAGDAIAGWVQYDAVNDVDAIYVRTYSFGGSWGSSERLSSTTENVTDFHGLNVSNSGTVKAFATWSAYLGTNQFASTRVASSTFGGAWSVTTVSSQ